ncbi:hypothetical protein CPBF367_38510 [Xanthomonas arboricola pv. juglandis]|nr:hypothetical protein CPBF367_38510 [Xanthomonas arboricola pv. juglandis]
MRPRQPLLCAHAAGLAKPRLVACTTAQWPSMLMQALSMDESRLLPKGARSVATHGRVRCACTAREGRSDLYSRGYCDPGFTRVFALFPGARARTAGPPTGRMWCPIALAMMTNGLHADEAGSEKRWGKAADVGCAASSAIWNSVAGRACVHAPAPACRCLSGRRYRHAAISNMQRCAAFRNTAMCAACDAAAGAGDTGRMKCDGQAAIAAAALRKNHPALHAQAQPRSG